MTAQLGVRCLWIPLPLGHPMPSRGLRGTARASNFVEYDRIDASTQRT